MYFPLKKVQVVFSPTEEQIDGDMGSTKSFDNVILWEAIATVFGPSRPNGNGYRDQSLEK
jgi:hypothetical protein